jgi:hypothetical protein
MSRTAIDADPAAVVGQLAELFEHPRLTPFNSGCVCIDRRDVAGLVGRLNRLAASDERRSVRANAGDPLVAVANTARGVVADARALPFSDDVVLRRGQAAAVARVLREAIGQARSG